MKSREDIERCRNMAQDAHRLLKELKNLTLIDLGEDEGFEDIADGICESIYDAEEKASDALDGLNEILEGMES